VFSLESIVASHRRNARNEKPEKANKKQQNIKFLIIAIVVVAVIIIAGIYLSVQQPAVNNNQTNSNQNNSQPVVSNNSNQSQSTQNVTPSNISIPSNVSNQTQPSKTSTGFCYDGTLIGECNSQGQYCTQSHTLIYNCNGSTTLGYPACGCLSGYKCITSGPTSGECLKS
jgi:cytoskeletal protein RodZ